MITTEMIDKVMQATGRDYFTIKESLEKNLGNIDLTIKELRGESTNNNTNTSTKSEAKFENETQNTSLKTDELLNKVKEIIKDGTASFITFEKGNKEYFRLNLALSGALLLISAKMVLLGIGAAFLTNFTVKVEMKNGNIVILNKEK